MNRIIKGDKVRVISGKQKGSEGTVLSVDIKNQKAIVEGLNIIKKHVKSQDGQEKGGIIQKEAPIYLCKLALMDAKHKNANTKVNYVIGKDGKKARVTKKSKTNLSEKAK
ncbi:MAG: 50S ribosomal protein L24 [Mycoplasma sp.]